MQANILLAQLDTIHWMPPMHARDEWGPQFLYLSTPETEAFEVTVRDGSGAMLTTVLISNYLPAVINLGGSNDTPVLVPEDQLHKPVQGKGLVIDGPKKFYAYFRAHSSSLHHACDLTCKGRAALGKTFRIGHLLQEIDDNNRRSNFVGVMATEDSTRVSLSGYHSATDFRINGANASAGPQLSVVLMRGESAVFSQYVGSSASVQPPNGLMGALLESSKPVAVNCGSWCGAPVVFMAHDIGIDQIAPIENVGKEYILCKGNGGSTLERPILIAHYDHTQIWINGAPAPYATLQAGQYLPLPTSAYSGNGNMYIQSSEPIFVYQMIGGASSGNDEMRTAGLIFVPPISCGIPNTVNNITQPNHIGYMDFEGGLMITAMRDSNVTVRINGAPVYIGPPAIVPGNAEFVTYRALSLFGQGDEISDISVVAEGAVQVAMYGRNQPASFAAFYSGFSKVIRPHITLNTIGDGVCPDTLVATGLFDGVQWMYEDSVLQYGTDTFFVAYAPGQYVASGYLGVCRRTDFANDTIQAEFNSPEFPYEIRDPSCYGLADGVIHFGQPYGGLEPYQYSVDHGQHFREEPVFDDIHTGNYNLVVRDATGCYNHPLDVYIGQPDSFTVHLVALNYTEPLRVGERVELEGIPGRSIVSVEWQPQDSSGCADCLRTSLHFEQSTWVHIRVYDAEGCPAVDSLLIEVAPNVYAPNAMTFDSDLGNDVFTLFSRTDLPLTRLLIFDRWGDLIFERRNGFTNSRDSGWNGMTRGKKAAPGVYVFWAEVEILPGRFEIVKGDFLLL